VESVHLADWPEADEGLVDPDLEPRWPDRTSSPSCASPHQVKLGVRQPSPGPVVLPRRPAARRSRRGGGRGRRRADVKLLDTVSDIEGLLEYTVVPNFRRLGPRLGPRLRSLGRALESVDGAAVARALDAGETFRVDLDDGDTVELGPDDVQIRAASHDEMALARDEGFASPRHHLATTCASRAARSWSGPQQRARPSASRSPTGSRGVTAGGTLAEAATRHSDWIASEVLATAWRVVDRDDAPEGRGAVVAVDGQEARVIIRRAAG